VTTKQNVQTSPYIVYLCELVGFFLKATYLSKLRIHIVLSQQIYFTFILQH